MDLSDLPPVEEPLARLAAYRKARADEQERERVVAALLKKPSDRTEREQRIVAYSRYGTGNSCGY